MKLCSRLAALFTIVSLTGCGFDSEPSKLQENPSPPAATTITFAEWCQNWQLQCDASTPAKTVSQAQFNAVLAIARSVLTSPSSWEITAEQFNLPSWNNALAALNWTAAFQPIAHLIQAVQFDNVQPVQSQLQLTLQNPPPYPSVSGLQMALDSTVNVDFQPQVVQLNGIQLNSGDHNLRLTSLSIDEQSQLQLTGDSFSITQVPPGFIARQLGLDQAAPAKPSRDQMLRALDHLVEWAANLNAHVQLEDPTFQVLSANLDPFVTDAANRQQFQVMLDAFQTIQTQSLDDKALTLNAQNDAGKQLACASQGTTKSQIMFATQWGIRHMRPMVNGTELELYGLKVKSKIFGPFSVSFELKRLEVFADRIVIYNVPVIGKYTYRFNAEKDPTNESWVCAS